MTNNTPAPADLLPCPFCGGRASANGSVRYNRPLADTAWDDGSPVTEAFFVNCVSCGATTPTAITGVHRTTEQAIAAWNRRAAAITPQPDPRDQVIAELREALQDICDNTYVGQHHRPVNERSKYGNYLAKYYHRAKATLAKSEGK